MTKTITNTTSELAVITKGDGLKENKLIHHEFDDLTEGYIISSGSSSTLSLNITLDLLSSRDIPIKTASSTTYKSEVLAFSFSLSEASWLKQKSSLNRSERFTIGIFREIRDHFAKVLGKSSTDTSFTIDPNIQTNYSVFDISGYTRIEKQLEDGHVNIMYMKNNEIFANEKMVDLEKMDTISHDDFPKYPIFIVEDDDLTSIDKKVELYKLILNSTTAAMLTNLSDPTTLAAQINNLSFYDENRINVSEQLAQTYLNMYHKKIDIAGLSPAEYTYYKNAEKLLNNFYDWVDYFFYQFLANDLLKPTHLVVNPYDVQVFEVVADPKFIEETLSNGLKNGQISFSDKSDFNYIDSFDKFMFENSPLMVNMISSTVQPIHEKGVIPFDVKNLVKKITDRSLEFEQIDTIAAGIKAFNRNDSFMLLGEPGVGKTVMSILTVLTHSRNRGITAKVAVVCPGTLVHSTWVEELLMTIRGSIENVTIHVVTNTKEMIELEERGIFEDDMEHFVIISENNLKAEFAIEPALKWSSVHKGFQCPSCGGLQTTKKENPEYKHDHSKPKTIVVPKKFNYYNNMSSLNYNCQHCDTPVWQPINKMSNKKDKYLYLPKKKGKQLSGFFPLNEKPFLEEIEELMKALPSIDSEKKKAQTKRLIQEYEDCIELIKNPEQLKQKISRYATSVSTYVEKKMKHKFTHLILDEAHEYQNASKRFNAMKSMVKSIRYVLCATGTSMNGYPKSRFLMDFLLFPHKLIKNGFQHNDIVKYQKTFGVTEETNKFQMVKGKEKKLRVETKDKPGISPIIFPLFMQDTCIFLELKDLSSNSLPPLTYEQIEVPLSKELSEAQSEFTHNLKRLAAEDKIDFVSALTTNISFLDTPQVSKTIYDHITGAPVYSSPTVSSAYDSKLKYLQNYIHSEVNLLGRRVLLYTQWTGDGINEYLQENLSSDFKVTLLAKTNEYSISCDGTKKKVKKDRRMDFIREELSKGTQVLLCSPELVKTGMNLREFPTIVYYQLGFQVYTLRQADRRAWRLGQTEDCKVVYIYYKDTFQNDIASIMSTKIVASQAIEGKMDAAGLEAILNERTPEEELQKRFYEGLPKELLSRKKEA